MRSILILFAASLWLLANPAWARNDAPSRPAIKGCKWEKLSNADAGLDAWTQRCDFGFRKIDLFWKANAIMIRYSDGGDPSALVEVFDLAAGESIEAGIKRLFAEHTADKALVAQCVLAPYAAEKPPAGVKRYTFVPNAALKKRLDAQADPNEVPDPPCGDWGDAPDGIQYFEAQPASGARKVLFVRVGQDEPLFDEKTLRLLPPVKGEKAP
ncbi:MAG TPA: hypothetical protein VHQ21_04960 [Rhodanobacteraceae bacterium]|jgi:hypothetical protein|nr:hypothetical protein [Rhodanobacteraceae bacterium]